MKVSIILLGLFFLITIDTIAQSKKELKEQITKLNSEQKLLKEDLETVKKQISELQNELEKLKKDNQQLRSYSNDQTSNSITNTSINQCKATTSKGSQCTRKNEAGSDYCWQHKSTYQPSESSNSSSPSTYSPSYSSGSNVIHTGPRGGKYYINSNGKKTYVKKK